MPTPSEPLFDPDREPRVDPADAVRIVHRFLQRCERWAERLEIPKRAARLADDPTAEDAAKLHAWLSYRDFTRHALRELEDGTLDHWFAEDAADGPRDDDPPIAER